MIRGYFSEERGRRRPFVDAVFQFPDLGNQSIHLPLLVDTGADRTILAPSDAVRLALTSGIDLADLPQGGPGVGVGGQTSTRVVGAVLTIDSYVTPLNLTLLEPVSNRILPIPSLLGRDILGRFGLFIEQRTARVLLLDSQESDALALPA